MSQKIYVTILVLCFLFSPYFLYAQKYFSRDVYVDLYAPTSIEDIRAVTKEASGIIDEENGAFVFKVPMKTLRFPKKVMRAHFNDACMETDRFPNAIFKGTIKNLQEVIADQSKQNNPLLDTLLIVTGEIEIHGVKKEIKVKASIKKQTHRSYVIASTFRVYLADFNIQYAIVRKIANEVILNVKSELYLLEK